MKRMFSKEELEAIIKNVTDIDEVKEDISNLEEVALNNNTKGFVDSEYNKQLNLVDYLNANYRTNSAVMSVSENNIIFTAQNTDYEYGIIYFNNLKVGHTYTISLNALGNGTYNRLYLSTNPANADEGKYPNTDITLTETETNYTLTITATETTLCIVAYINAGSSDAGKTISLNNIMIVKGTTPATYQAYNGAVLHEKDITPVLLWENATPNTSMSATTITIGDTTGFKYIDIAYKYFANSTNGIVHFKFKNETGKSVFIISGNLGTEIASREFVTTDSTHIELKTGKKMDTGESYTAPENNNTFIVPIAIYGTNV